MTQHTPQPRLCEECEAVAHALAESGPLTVPVLKRCIHNSTVAVGYKRNDGSIANWYIEGPLTDDQAHQLAAAVIANKPIHFPRRQ